MTEKDKCEKKCFTFTWRLENASYCWQDVGVCIESPVFEIAELEETKWRLKVFPRSRFQKNAIALYLQRDKSSKSEKSIEIDYELAMMVLDGTVLKTVRCEKETFKNNWYSKSEFYISRNEVFIAKRAAFLPQNTLTVRCRVWENGGEFSQDILCFARTRIVVEKRLFTWNIENFSLLKSDEKKTYEIKELETGKQLMLLELFVTGGQIFDEKVRFAVILSNEIIKTSSLQMFVMDADKNVVKCFQDEFWYLDSNGTRDFLLFPTKNHLIENKRAYLPNDVLSLQCEFSFTSGIIFQETDIVISDRSSAESIEPEEYRLLKEKCLPVPKWILIDNMKSMLNNSRFSDVKLRTNGQIYPAHKCILSSRSPVFEAMFSNDMKEKMNDCVDIEGLNDDTVSRMLRYIYSAEVEELEWSSATELYEAADQYQILNLRDVCSSYLKDNLHPSNVCRVLLLADLHQDESLKSFARDFILIHGKDINSEEWEKLMGTNLKLAAEIMCLKFQE